MRDIIFLISVAGYLGIALFCPFAGMLVWTWLAIGNPHQEAYSFAKGLPINLTTALVTVVAWLVAKEKKTLPRSVTIGILIAFLVWTTFNSFFAFDPSWSWQYWDRTWRIVVYGLLLAVMTDRRARFHAVIWVAVISLAYYGVKGGLFTILTGGVYHVLGPPSSIVGDNNQLALALVMTLPLLCYLHRQSAARLVRWCIVAMGALLILTVFGTYSRGGIIALAVLSVVFWIRTRRRLLYPVVAAGVGVAALSFMPDAYWARLDSIQNYGNDQSFIGRVDAWMVAYHYALDHFPFGAGFYGPQLQEIFAIYAPGRESHAAHSIFFQVLGEQGFIGLALYISLFVTSFFDLRRVMLGCRGQPHFRWASDLATMMQLSLVAFAVGGAALSMAYYDMFVLVICVGAALRAHVGQELASSLPRAASHHRQFSQLTPPKTFAN